MTMISEYIILLLLLLLHLLDHSQCNCEKLRFHNNGIVMMNLSITAALGSWCTQPSFCTYYCFAYISTLSFNSKSFLCSLCTLGNISDCGIIELTIPTYNSTILYQPGSIEQCTISMWITFHNFKDCDSVVTDHSKLVDQIPQFQWFDSFVNTYFCLSSFILWITFTFHHS